MDIELTVFIVELLGTVAFAVTGVMCAIERKLDVFGAIVLGGTTAVGGGCLRDIILGISPPTLFTSPVFVLVAVGTSLLTFILEYIIGTKHKSKREIYTQTVNAFDAVGLAVFVVVGVNTAIVSGNGGNAFLSIFVGVLTGIGGGIIRDILAGRVPVVLHKRIYALAAILGAVVYYYMREFGVAQQLSLIIGGGIIIVIRILATAFRWSLPKIPTKEQ